MALDRLWAPWRMDFIRTAHQAGGCFLCEAASGSDDRELLVVRRGKTCFCVLNRYPYNNGHLLISPYRHEGPLERLTSEELSEIMAMTVESKQVLDRVAAAHGYNIGVNLGRAAGAGLEDHLHFHVIPRWQGDTNFITTVGSAKVIPQALEEMWTLVSDAWCKVGAD